MAYKTTPGKITVAINSSECPSKIQYPPFPGESTDRPSIIIIYVLNLARTRQRDIECLTENFCENCEYLLNTLKLFNTTFLAGCSFLLGKRSFSLQRFLGGGVQE